MRRLARGRRGGGFEYHASLLPEAARVAIYQYALGEAQRSRAGESASCVRNKEFAAGPAGDVPPAASSPLEPPAAPGRDLNGASRNPCVPSVENSENRRLALSTR